MIQFQVYLRSELGKLSDRSQAEWFLKSVNHDVLKACSLPTVATELVAALSSQDSQAAHERLEVLKPMTLLETSDQALDLAKELIQAGALPAKAADDALHIAVAAMNGIPYLLTWNCRHLANATMRPVIENVCAGKGVKAPIICTPEELLEAKP
jgi:predicted nucleic acid-binding protein